MRCCGEKSNELDMKAVTMILLLACQQHVLTVKQIREIYFKAAVNKNEVRKLGKLLDTVGMHSPPVLICYKGAADMLQARYAFDPFRKLQYFKRGRALIERSVALDTSCIESRFIRLTIQYNLPAFLNYNQNIYQDSCMVANNVLTLNDEDLKVKINTYLSGLHVAPKKE